MTAVYYTIHFRLYVVYLNYNMSETFAWRFNSDVNAACIVQNVFVEPSASKNRVCRAASPAHEINAFECKYAERLPEITEITEKTLKFFS